MKTEKEIVREGKRILRRLAHGARLAPTRKGDFTIGATQVEGEIVAEFRKRDWLSPDDRGGFLLSDAGRGWLLRTDCSEGNAFAAQHQALVERIVTAADGSEHVVLVNEAESPLAWLRRRRHIDAAQFAAGERLRRDYTLAHLTPRLGVDLSAPAHGTGGHNAPLADTVIAARQRFSRAMAAAGPSLSDLLFDICCHLKRLENAERTFGWPPRSAKIVLQIALDRLAAHYGMGTRGPERARMRSWQMGAVS
jgi:hypothetical protein